MMQKQSKRIEHKRSHPRHNPAAAGWIAYYPAARAAASGLHASPHPNSAAPTGDRAAYRSRNFGAWRDAPGRHVLGAAVLWRPEKPNSG